MKRLRIFIGLSNTFIDLKAVLDNFRNFLALSSNSRNFRWQVAFKSFKIFIKTGENDIRLKKTRRNVSPLKHRTPFWGNLYHTACPGWKVEKHPRREWKTSVRERERAGASIGLKHPGIFYWSEQFKNGISHCPKKLPFPCNGETSDGDFRKVASLLKEIPFVLCAAECRNRLLSFLSLTSGNQRLILSFNAFASRLSHREVCEKKL